MMNKYKISFSNEISSKEISENDTSNLKFNSTINDFSDLNKKKMFIENQLTLNNDKFSKKERKISLNNDLKVYKHAQIRKKLYPQSNILLHPTLRNDIEKISKDENNNEHNLTVGKSKNPLLNSIQVKRKNKEKNEIVNKNNNYTQSNQSKKNSQNFPFNYTKKKVIFHGKNNSILNQNKSSNILELKIPETNKNQNKHLLNGKLLKSLEKNNRNFEVINNISNYIKTEINSNKFRNNFQIKNKFLLFPNKKTEINELIDSKTIDIKNSELSNINNSPIKNDSIHIDYSMVQPKKMNNDKETEYSNINMTQTINDIEKENINDKEKRRYIYINRRIQNLKNENKNNFRYLNKSNKIIEINVENNNKIKSSALLKDDVVNYKYSLTDKKEEIKNNIKSKINPYFRNKVTLSQNKTKINKTTPFSSLKFLVHKAHEIEELGDSFGKFYMNGPNSARNLQYKSTTLNHRNFTLNGNNNKTLSDFVDTNIDNQIPKKKFTNLLSESKKHFRKLSNLSNSEINDGINYANKIINNNTFNTTVNFYKINPISSDLNNNSISQKTNILSKIKNNLGHARVTSDYSSYSSILGFLLNNKKTSNKENNSKKNDKEIKEEITNKENDISFEILYTLELKLKNILFKVNNYNICYNECYDWINYYFNCKFYEKEINLFKLNHNKNNIIYYIKVELLCYFLCYDISFNKNFNQAGILLKTIFNLLHINYLILISFIIYGNNKNRENEDNNGNFYFYKLKEIAEKELKIKLYSQDMNESNILLLISNNFKEINNYYKMIIDNLYSYYYSLNNKNEFKFPASLSLDINSLNNIDKLNIISIFFFDAYRFSNNYNFKDLEKFFELYLCKSISNEILTPNDNIIINKNLNLYNDNNNFKNMNEFNNKYILNEEKYYDNILINEYYLPPIKPYYKYTLVLDLDETLVYFQKDNNLLNNNTFSKNTLILRPGLLDFLNKMKTLYELVLFSFGTKEYVYNILNVIEKNEKIFEYVLYRQHATYEKGEYVKNLALLGRDLKKIIIVDDIPHVFKMQKSNGIRIKAFYGDIISDRNTLKLLGKILERIRFEADENDGDLRKCLQNHGNLIFSYITTNLEN